MAPAWNRIDPDTGLQRYMHPYEVLGLKLGDLSGSELEIRQRIRRAWADRLARWENYDRPEDHKEISLMGDAKEILLEKNLRETVIHCCVLHNRAKYFPPEHFLNIRAHASRDEINEAFDWERQKWNLYKDVACIVISTLQVAKRDMLRRLDALEKEKARRDSKAAVQAPPTPPS